MGLFWIVTMHKPIKDSGGDPKLLGVGRGDNGFWLGASHDNPGNRWDCGGGFVFVVSQVSNF
jgi:hypothetical protein